MIIVGFLSRELGVTLELQGCKPIRKYPSYIYPSFPQKCCEEHFPQQTSFMSKSFSECAFRGTKRELYVSSFQFVFQDMILKWGFQLDTC